MTSKQTIGLCDFLEAVGRAGAVARQQCATANIGQLTDYLEEVPGEDFLRFRTVDVKIGEEITEVPIYGLVPCGHLDMKNLEIEFQTLVDMSLEQSGYVNGNPKISLGMSSGLLKKGTEVRLLAKFDLRKPCETSEQIRDKLNKYIAIIQETQIQETQIQETQIQETQIQETQNGRV